MQDKTVTGQTLAALLLVSATAFGVQPAQAIGLDTGNEDLSIRWDNNVRYNLGVRADRQDGAILNTTNYDDSDAKFKRGDVVMNRVDVLSEFDVVYKKKSGLRLSAALWYDDAYRDTSVRSGPLYSGNGMSGAYPNDRYTSYTSRWNRGPSAEFLDAFVFTGFDVGDMPAQLRLGQHTVYWGESLFSFVHGVSYGQGPVDIRKALANPGVEAKEIFKPLTQLSGSLQLNDELSIAGQYFFDWKASVFPDGGTYFGVLDPLSGGGGTYLINPTAAAATSAQLGVPVSAVPFVPAYNKPKKVGDWGLMTRWTPSALGGASFGGYLRSYTDKLPQLVMGGIQPSTLATYPNVVPSSFGLDYARHRTTLVGASAAWQMAGVSFGAEVAHRQNGPLLMGDATFTGEGPYGDTWHALLNGVAFVGRTPVFDSAALTAELTYSRLDKIRTNANNYRSHATDKVSCPTSSTLGCASKNYWGVAMKFEPKWFQVFPSVDLSMPIVYNIGLKGNSQVLFGGYEGNGGYSVGLTATAKEKYTLTLAYNDSVAKHRTTSSAALGGAPVVSEVGGIGAQWDRGWVSLTFKTAF